MKNPFLITHKVFGTILLCVFVGGAAAAQQKITALTPAEQKQLTQLSPGEQKQIKQLPLDQQDQILSGLVDMKPAERKRYDLLEEMRKALNVKDPVQQMVVLAEFVKSHPDLVSEGTDGPVNVAFTATDYIKSHHNNPVKLKATLAAIDDAFPSSADLGKSLYESFIAKSLLSHSVALEYAEFQAQSSIHLLHEDDYVVYKKAEHAEREQYEERDKDYVPEEFFPADAKADFAREVSERYAVLGGIQKKLGKNDAALDSFKHSLDFHPDMGAYVGLSKLEEAKGEKSAALENLYDADLTGHLGKADIAHMKQMYAELHPSSNEQALETLLDDKYRSQFQNPVHFVSYAGSHASHRAVLAELFTGAGCEPCMSPDLAFDAALHRYARDEMVLLVYHDNAPDSDPLANNVTDERDKYYSTGGSTPHVLLDGREIGVVQGPPTHAQDSFDGIAKSIDKLLDVPAAAEINVHAKRHGSKVTVTVKGSMITPGPNTVLHLDLLETEVSYSGENTLRFQPMVVRATAEQKTDGSGFNVSNRAKFDVKYTFDLKKVTSANFAYYSQYNVGLMKRTHGMLSADYREYENTMNPDRLAVVAFVQNDATKAVLQAAYTPVASHSSSTTKSEEQ